MKTILLALALSAIAQSQTITILPGSATDQYFTGTPCNTYPVGQWSCPYTDAGLAGSQLDAPYTSLRYGQTVTYQIPVPEGIYTGQVILIEPNKTAAGQRLETVTVQGQVSPFIDIFKSAGGVDRPYVFPFTAVASVGLVTIQVTGQAGQNAVISGIVLNPPPLQLVQWFSMADGDVTCTGWKIPGATIGIKYGCSSPRGQNIGNYIAASPGGVEAIVVSSAPINTSSAANPQVPFLLSGPGLGVLCMIFVNGTTVQLASSAAAIPPNGATYSCAGGPNTLQSGSMVWP